MSIKDTSEFLTILEGMGYKKVADSISDSMPIKRRLRVNQIKRFREALK